MLWFRRPSVTARCVISLLNNEYMKWKFEFHTAEGKNIYHTAYHADFDLLVRVQSAPLMDISVRVDDVWMDRHDAQAVSFAFFKARQKQAMHNLALKLEKVTKEKLT